MNISLPEKPLDTPMGYLSRVLSAKNLWTTQGIIVAFSPVCFLGLSLPFISHCFYVWGLDCEILDRWKLHLVDICTLNISYSGFLINICSVIKIPMMIIIVRYIGYLLCAKNWTKCFSRIFSLNSPSKSKRCVLHLFSFDGWETEV